MLFIYFNVPSNSYQGRIVSFLAFGWSVFLFTAYTDPQKQSALVRAILIAGAGALIGLGIVNSITDFHTCNSNINASVFWMETAGVFVYWLWLFVFYFRSNLGNKQFISRSLVRHSYRLKREINLMLLCNIRK